MIDVIVEPPHQKPYSSFCDPERNGNWLNAYSGGKVGRERKCSGHTTQHYIDLGRHPLNIITESIYDND